MSIITIICIAIALAMDAFAVSLSTGVAMCRIHNLGLALRMAAWFGIFQAIMPVVGWGLGRFAASYIEAYDHWVAFGLLAVVGGKMIYEALKLEEVSEEAGRDPHSTLMLLTLAIATSIDAAAVGVSLSCLSVDIVAPAIIIGVITFVISFIGTYIGCRVGHFFGKKVEIFGGIVLIGIGIKIVLDHFFKPG